MGDFHLRCGRRGIWPRGAARLADPAVNVSDRDLCAVRSERVAVHDAGVSEAAATSYLRKSL